MWLCVVAVWLFCGRLCVGVGLVRVLRCIAPRKRKLNSTFNDMTPSKRKRLGDIENSSEILRKGKNFFKSEKVFSELIGVMTGVVNIRFQEILKCNIW